MLPRASLALRGQLLRSYLSPTGARLKRMSATHSRRFSWCTTNPFHRSIRSSSSLLCGHYLQLPVSFEHLAQGYVDAIKKKLPASCPPATIAAVALVYTHSLTAANKSITSLTSQSRLPSAASGAATESEITGAKKLQKDRRLCDEATRSKIEAWMSKAAPAPEVDIHCEQDMLSRVSEASGVETCTLQTYLSAIEKMDAKSSLQN